MCMVFFTEKKNRGQTEGHERESRWDKLLQCGFSGLKGGGNGEVFQLEKLAKGKGGRGERKRERETRDVSGNSI